MRLETIVLGIVMCLLALLVVVMVASKSDAATQCGPYGAVSKMLTVKFGEAPRASGTIGKDAALRIMQAWVSDDGSWTILITAPTGRSCIAIAGQDWEDVPFEPGQKS